MTALTGSRAKLLAAIAAGVLLLGLCHPHFRAIMLMRGYGFLVFNWMLLPLAALLLADLLLTRERVAVGPPALILFGGIIVLGLFDAGRNEPNISRRLLPIILPLLHLILATAVCQRFRQRPGRLRALLYGAAILFFLIASWRQYQPFRDFSDYDSLNPAISEIAAAVPDNGILIIDYPASLLDTPLLFHTRTAIVRAEALTAEQLLAVIAYGRERQRPVYLLLSHIAGDGSPIGALPDVLPPGLATKVVRERIDLVWVDTANRIEFPSFKPPMHISCTLVRVCPQS